MASFVGKLWDSVFTPGPTPTLMVATNAAFAALQLILIALLLSTRSIHFVILSFLTAGLWWAINWFVGELREAQKKEDEAARIREARQRAMGDRKDGMDSGDDTETETELDKSREDLLRRATRTSGTPGQTEEVAAGSSRSSQGGSAGRTATGTQLRPDQSFADALRKRRSSGGTGELSTDSEWEKVDEDR